MKKLPTHDGSSGSKEIRKNPKKSAIYRTRLSVLFNEYLPISQLTTNSRKYNERAVGYLGK